MSVRDRFLAAFVALLWGLNFLAVRIGLDHYPPLFLSALRFLVLAVPVVLFVPRPKAPVRWLVLYGMGFGVLQFGLLFIAIDRGMPSGLASVVVQAAAPFTMVLGAALFGERVSRWQVAGIALAVLGMTVIALDRSRTAALLPLLLTVLAAFGWALGNIAGRQARPDHPLRFALWMAVVPPVPLLVLSAVMEGPGTGWRALGASFGGDGWPALVALAYTALAGSVVGSGIWTGLLKRNEAATVAPFSMLVPVVGVAVAWLFLGERLTGWAAVGSAAVVGGVLLGSARVRVRRAAPADRTPPARGGRTGPSAQPSPGPASRVQDTNRS
ncbi:EamA family transporter [Streptomyces sp. NPDC093085]|uniref:EamA family transporter n=1 Tax=Streptomyces sp. NPDC093085 TaxID=3155068 RepID=UPI0034408135